jgi:hypothetical protein
MGVREQGIAVRVEKIGGAEARQLGSELGHHRKPIRQGRWRRFAAPQMCETP